MGICQSLTNILALLALIPLLYPHPILAQTIPFPSPIIPQPGYMSHIAYTAVSPITVPGERKPVRRVIRPQVKTYYTRATSSGNCVATLKQAGLLPQGRVTKDGRAATIPIKPLNLKEGEKAVVRTSEGPLGHVLQVKLEKGKYVSTVEGGYTNGVGRVVNPALIAGEVAL